MLNGRMMDFPLTMTHFLNRAQSLFSANDLMTRQPDGSIAHSSYAHLYRHSARIAGALRRLGVHPGDRVASIAWNHQRHFELSLGVSCYGAVFHALNIHLPPADLAYIADHAQDRFIFVDRALLPVFSRIADRLRYCRGVIVMNDGTSNELPEGAIDFDELVSTEHDVYDYPELEERSACSTCYTSGTTGMPKGVVYSHRAMVLHALVCNTSDALSINESDCILPIPSMFHANAWGLPFAGLAAGSRLVFPGQQIDSAAILNLIEHGRVTLSYGVPSIWLGVLSQLDREPGRWDVSTLRTLVIGGAAAPPALIEGFRSRYGVEVLHQWGMTELSPIGSLGRCKESTRAQGEVACAHARSSQGHAVPLVEHRHVSETGAVLPRDGSSVGELEVRGPFVVASYANDEGADRFTQDGWFRTGDVVTIDPDGYLRLQDRAKDVIRSGDEWISSVALENALMCHPAVQEAAVFAARDPQWCERPIAAVVLKSGCSATNADLLLHLGRDFAPFWLPDAFLFLPQLPKTTTGKFLKSRLREQYGAHQASRSVGASAR